MAHGLHRSIKVPWHVTYHKRFALRRSTVHVIAPRPFSPCDPSWPAFRNFFKDRQFTNFEAVTSKRCSMNHLASFMTLYDAFPNRALLLHKYPEKFVRMHCLLLKSFIRAISKNQTSPAINPSDCVASLVGEILECGVADVHQDIVACSIFKTIDNVFQRPRDFSVPAVTKFKDLLLQLVESVESPVVREQAINPLKSLLTFVNRHPLAMPRLKKEFDERVIPLFFSEPVQEPEQQLELPDLSMSADVGLSEKEGVCLSVLFSKKV